MADQAVKALLFALHDSLMLLAPRGWARVDLRFEGGRLKELTTKGQGAKGPEPTPCLGLEAELEAQRLSQGVDQLMKVLGRPAAEAVVVERGDGFADWKLEGAAPWFMRLERDELDALLVTDALFAAVLGTERAFADLQTSLDATLAGYADWRFDGRLLELTRAGKTLSFPAELVGRYLAGSFTWTWGWADEALAPQTVEGVKRVCAPSARPPGLSAFWRDRYQCDEGFAWALASHVAVAMGARGLYQGMLNDGSVSIFAVLRPSNAN